MAQESWKREEEATGCQLPEGPILCTNNCGFFGSVATMNLCSKCYREHILKQSKPASTAVPTIDMSSIKGLQQPPPEPQFELNIKPAAEQAAATFDQVPTPPLPLIPSATEGPTKVVPSPVAPKKSISTSAASSASSTTGAPEAQRTPNRCFTCRKRVGLTGFKCRCGDTFCNIHRYSDKHNCSYDYKAAGREAIAKANPVVKAEKIEKI